VVVGAALFLAMVVQLEVDDAMAGGHSFDKEAAVGLVVGKERHVNRTCIHFKKR
jgi:hypothetical protein